MISQLALNPNLRILSFGHKRTFCTKKAIMSFREKMGPCVGMHSDPETSSKKGIPTLSMTIQKWVMTPFFWVIIPFFKGHGESGYGNGSGHVEPRSARDFLPRVETKRTRDAPQSKTVRSCISSQMSLGASLHLPYYSPSSQIVELYTKLTLLSFLFMLFIVLLKPARKNLGAQRLVDGGAVYRHLDTIREMVFVSGMDLPKWSSVWCSFKTTPKGSF